MALTAKKLENVRPTVPVSEVAKGHSGRLNLVVPAAKKRTWKLAAIEHDMTMSELVEIAVDAYLKKLT